MVEGESGFEELSSCEVVLVFGAGDVGAFDILRICELRVLRGQICVLFVKVVNQEACSENVAAGQIGLDLGEIADASDVVAVLIGR